MLHQYLIKPASALTFIFLSLPAFSEGQVLKPATVNNIKQNGTIQWDDSSRRRISSPNFARYSGYGRIIQLSDESLLAVYEADGNIVAAKSQNLGDSWSESIVISAAKEGFKMCVPDLIKLDDQRILAFYNARPYNISPNRKFGIHLRQSTDGGQSWGAEQILYQAGHQFENGCWEPSAIQLPNGEIQLFFANEGPYTKSNEQNISMLRSIDHGASWSKTPSIVSFRPGKRDGMPVPLLLRNKKEIVLAIEDNAVRTFKPYILRNTLQKNWANTISGKSADRSYALHHPIANEIYAGAPYIRQLSTGETILSYQSTEGRTNKMDYADMKVLIGNERAMNFKNKSVPFVIPQNKSCLWNSITVLSDDTILAITSTNAYSDQTEVWMVKGKFLRDPEDQGTKDQENTEKKITMLAYSAKKSRQRY